MAYSSGTYTAPTSSWNPAVANTAINVADWTTLLADLTTALTTCLLKDGSQTATAVIPFALGISVTTGGILFPATQSASSNVNTLDDYEEGVFTPVVTFGGASVGITYTVQGGVYQKIGNRAFFSLQITLTDNGSSAGAMLITALPFTAANDSANNSACAIVADALAASVTTQIMASVAKNTTTIELFRFAAGALTQLTDVDTTNTTLIRLSGHYYVS